MEALRIYTMNSGVITLANLTEVDSKLWMARNSLCTSDGISMFIGVSGGEPYVVAVNIHKFDNKAIIRLKDNKVVYNVMSEYSLKKLISVYKINKEFLLTEARQVLENA
jgi:hypothetical protein